MPVTAGRVDADKGEDRGAAAQEGKCARRAGAEAGAAAGTEWRVAGHAGGAQRQYHGRPVIVMVMMNMMMEIVILLVILKRSDAVTRCKCDCTE